MDNVNKLIRAPGVKTLECASEALDLFSSPYVERTLDRSYVTEVNPQNALSSSSSSIRFVIAPSDDFTDISETLVEVKVKITTVDGKKVGAIAAANSYGLINLPLATLFQNLTIKVGQTVISNSYSTYPYLSFFQTLMSYEEASRDTRLRLMGYVHEKDPTALAAQDDATASAYKTRAQWTATSKELTLVGPIFHELHHQKRMLIPHCELQYEWTKASDDFAIISNKADCDYLYDITSMKMLVRRQKVVASEKLEIERSLDSGKNAIYPVLQAQMKPFFIDANETNCTFENIFGGKTIDILIE